MNRLMLVVVLVLPVWLAGCGKPETAVSYETPQVNPEPQLSTAPVNTIPAQATPPTVTNIEQSSAALQVQAEQLMLMQLQQQIAVQNINRLGQLGTDVSEQLYRQGMARACYIQGNCTVRTITVPAY